MTLQDTQNKAKFIVIEGLEGAGKSTAIDTIYQYLQQSGIQDIVCTREPGGTDLAEQLRALVKKDYTHETLTPEAECLIMYAARMQLVKNVIQPKLEQGVWVIGDRHDLSSRAYQGGGRELTSLVDQVSQATLAGFKPDLTLYLDIDPQLGLERVAKRGALDRIEKENLDFFIRTRTRYLDIAQSDDSIHIIDAQQSIEQVQAQIQSTLKKSLSHWL